MRSSGLEPNTSALSRTARHLQRSRWKLASRLLRRLLDPAGNAFAVPSSPPGWWALRAASVLRLAAAIMRRRLSRQRDLAVDVDLREYSGDGERRVDRKHLGAHESMGLERR